MFNQNRSVKKSVQTVLGKLGHIQPRHPFTGGHHLHDDDHDNHDYGNDDDDDENNINDDDGDNPIEAVPLTPALRTGEAPCWQPIHHLPARNLTQPVSWPQPVNDGVGDGDDGDHDDDVKEEQMATAKK